MPPINGAQVLLGINVGTEGSPSFSLLGSQTNVGIDENVDVIDYSTKDDAARAVGGGRYSFSVTLDALFVPSSTEYAILKQRFRSREKILIRKELDGGAWEQARVLIASLSEEFPDQAPATISIGLEGDGVWEAV